MPDLCSSEMSYFHCCPQCPDLPLTVVEEILLYLPGQQVICVCRLVCKEWKLVVDSTAFWRERCRREGFKPLSIPNVPRYWQAFYFLCKMRRNLLKNPNADGEQKNNND